MQDADLRLARLAGPELAARLDDLARLRLEVFREFPYLYVGDAASEAEYLESLAASPRAVLVVAFDGDRVVGASTGLPLDDEPPDIQAPYRAGGFDPARTFYLGESVLRRPWRGRGLGVAFFAEREAHARALGGFTHAAFCAVVRPPDHPRRPADHVPLDAFWGRRGYAPVPGVVVTMRWRDLDEEAESPKRLQAWAKVLEPAPL